MLFLELVPRSMSGSTSPGDSEPQLIQDKQPVVDPLIETISGKVDSHAISLDCGCLFHFSNLALTRAYVQLSPEMQNTTYQFQLSSMALTVCFLSKANNF
jgi:hypothetical protein